MPHKRVALLGAPGVGKSTQAVRLRRSHGLCQVSAEALRAAEPSASQDTLVQRILERVAEPQCRRGFVLEDFPGTQDEATTLQDALLKAGRPLDHAVLLEAPPAVAESRLKGRLLHPASGRIYHAENEGARPVVAGKDDITGEPLQPFPREHAAARAEQFRAGKEALLGVFRQQPKLVAVVPAGGDPSTVAAAILQEFDR